MMLQTYLNTKPDLWGSAYHWAVLLMMGMHASALWNACKVGFIQHHIHLFTGQIHSNRGLHFECVCK